MQIVAKRTLVEFWRRHPQAQTPLSTWHHGVEGTVWRGPSDIKAQFGSSVDFIGDNRVIFDIAGNKFRLVVHVSYRFKSVLIKFVGTHAEYDKIDAETI
jgi:mRNA interferase HigB